MFKKKALLLSLAILCVSAIVVSMININVVSADPNISPPSNGSNLFHVPENPLGTLGLFSALALAFYAFRIFTLRKKKY